MSFFWKGHVAMCINSNELIHAYGPEKKVLIMPILQTIKRIDKTAKLKVKKISSIRILISTKIWFVYILF